MAAKIRRRKAWPKGTGVRLGDGDTYPATISYEGGYIIVQRDDLPGEKNFPIRIHLKPKDAMRLIAGICERYIEFPRQMVD
jgi:hypothetical protein